MYSMSCIIIDLAVAVVDELEIYLRTDTPHLSTCPRIMGVTLCTCNISDLPDRVCLHVYFCNIQQWVNMFYLSA
jgi:hypothetical protein